jgi:hypothetical protein
VRRVAAVLAGVVAWLPATAEGHGRGCSTRECDVRVAHEMGKRRRLAVVAPYRAWLLRVAECESGQRWSIATGNGFYGGLQFTLRSWAGVGGRGYPHQATRLEQMYRGVLLLRSQGRRAWPVCG